MDLQTRQCDSLPEFPRNRSIGSNSRNSLSLFEPKHPNSTSRGVPAQPWPPSPSLYSSTFAQLLLLAVTALALNVTDVQVELADSPRGQPVKPRRSRGERKGGAGPCCFCFQLSWSCCPQQVQAPASLSAGKQTPCRGARPSALQRLPSSHTQKQSFHHQYQMNVQ